ncbi:MAG: cation:proton antiporter, partial [Halobacteriaceae archaeon]
MVSTGLERELIDLLAIFIIAGGVGVFVAKATRVPYTIALLVAGFIVSVVGIDIGVRLTHDVIILVLLPPLLFEGAATTDVSNFRQNLPIIAAVSILGLILSIIVVGSAVHYFFEFEWLIALLFAIIILPTDPVSVLAIFEEIGAPERLSVIVEGESLINDGLGVVLFTTVLGLISANATVAELVGLRPITELIIDIGLSIIGGAAVGLIAGYGVYRVMINLDEHMTEIILTILLAYGAFLLAEHYVNVSGVIATVAAGLLMGNRGREYAMSAQTKISVFNTWETGAFIANTFIFVVLG